MTFRHRPLVRMAPNGKPYIAPGAMPARPWSTNAPSPWQPARDTPNAPEPPAKPRVDRRPKLSVDAARAIRADYPAGRWTQHDLAYIHGVSQATISALLKRTMWRHVTDQPTERD